MFRGKFLSKVVKLDEILDARQYLTTPTHTCGLWGGLSTDESRLCYLLRPTTCAAPAKCDNKFRALKKISMEKFLASAFNPPPSRQPSFSLWFSLINSWKKCPRDSWLSSLIRISGQFWTCAVIVDWRKINHVLGHNWILSSLMSILSLCWCWFQVS